MKNVINPMLTKNRTTTQTQITHAITFQWMTKYHKNYDTIRWTTKPIHATTWTKKKPNQQIAEKQKQKIYLWTNNIATINKQIEMSKTNTNKVLLSKNRIPTHA